MRKIIITFIATIVLIATFEKAQGQAEIISVDFPTTNATVGANLGLSISIWRLELFALQLGYGLQLFEERMTFEGRGGVNNEYYLPRFASMFNLRFTGLVTLGLGYKITERDIIRFGLAVNNVELANTDIYGIGRDYSSDRVLGHFFLEYAHRLRLSQRASLDLSAGVGYGVPGLNSVSGISFSHTAIELGVRWNYEIVPNLKFGIRLGYMRRFLLSHSEWGEGRLENPEIFMDGFTRNFIDLSVGLLYRIQIASPFVTDNRPRPQPRQQVSPRHRALPCPPGQMRHLRSWDRPSSVFNHPTAR